MSWEYIDSIEIDGHTFSVEKKWRDDAMDDKAYALQLLDECRHYENIINNDYEVIDSLDELIAWKNSDKPGDIYAVYVGGTIGLTCLTTYDRDLSRDDYSGSPLFYVAYDDSYGDLMTAELYLHDASAVDSAHVYYRVVHEDTGYEAATIPIMYWDDAQTDYLELCLEGFIREALPLIGED